MRTWLFGASALASAMLLFTDAFARGGHSYSHGRTSFGMFAAIVIFVFLAPILWLIAKVLVVIGFEKLTSLTSRTLNRLRAPGRFS